MSDLPTTAEPEKTVVVFVPALKGPHYAGVRDVLKPEAHELLRPHETAPPGDWNVGKYGGPRFSISAGGKERVVDVVEIDYESAVHRLSSDAALTRFWFGIVLLLKAATVRLLLVRKLLRHLPRPGWFGAGYLTGVGLLLVAAWTYVIGTSLVAVAEKAISPSWVAWLQHAPWIIPSLQTWFVAHMLPLIEPKGWIFLAAGAFIFVFKTLGFDANSFTDVTDAYERYLNDRSDRQSTLRMTTILRSPVEDAIGALSKAGYDRIVVAGHCFGAVIAADAAALSRTPVELITVGAFFDYVHVFNRTGMTRILDAIRDSSITRWYDVYSADDLLAASTAFSEAPRIYKGVRVDIPGVSFAERIGSRSHAYYFRCPELHSLMCVGTTDLAPGRSPSPAA